MSQTHENELPSMFCFFSRFLKLGTLKSGISSQLERSAFVDTNLAIE
jgi:hypothetical protein